MSTNLSNQNTFKITLNNIISCFFILVSIIFPLKPSYSKNTCSQTLAPFSNIKNNIINNETIWAPSISIQNLIARSSSDEARNTIIANSRPKLWVQGTYNEIQLGDYFVHFQKKMGKQFNLIHDWEDLVNNKIWYRGLKNNISTTVAGKPCLITDNHYYALAFILEMVAKGILKHKGNSMTHIDDHDDLFPNYEFDPYLYLSLKPQNRLTYLLETINIADWQDPLLKSQIVDEKKWSHISIFDENTAFIKSIKETFTLYNLNIIPVKEIDIVDIDIDVLHPLDSKLSGEEKKKVLQGQVPKNIQTIIIKLAQMLKKAKVITIATSPGFIDQKRSHIYIKEILKQVETPSQKSDLRYEERSTESSS